MNILGLLKRSSATRTLHGWMSRRLPWAARSHEEAIRFYAQFIRAGDLVFDVGAHWGNRTELFLALGARVVCVEPQRSCLRHLSRRFGRNRNVTIIPKGAADAEGSAELSVCEDATTISTLSLWWKREGRFASEHRWAASETISLTTLDALIALHGRPQFCKIDVEGFEASVLAGLTQPLPCLSFEFTREFFPDAERCITRLLAVGPTTFNCSLGESMELLLPQWVSPDALSEALRSRPDPLLWGDIYARSLSPLA